MQLMVTDIQGVGYCLCDPEIASTQQVDLEDDSIVFCTGNLSVAAINTFKSEHQCNTYCKLLKLENFPEWINTAILPIPGGGGALAPLTL